MTGNLTIPAGRLTRGNGRPLDRITLILPLTASGLIAEDDLTVALTTLLTYAPYAIDPSRFRHHLAAALIAIHAANQDPPIP